MNIIKLNFILFFGFFALLVGCGGKTVDSAKDLEEVRAENLVKIKDIEKQIVGYWVSANSTNPEYEFFASSAMDFSVSTKQGRIFESGKVTNLFHWQLQDSGTILLTLVDSLCASRPLSLCRTVGTIKIQAIGSSMLNATWSIRYEDTNEINNRNIESMYSRKHIDFSTFSQGKFALSSSEVFDFLRVIEITGNEIILWWPRTDAGVQKLSASFYVGMKEDIKFDSDESAAFYETADFFVDGIGNKILQVKAWYEKVVLSASEGNTYSLSYELHRQIQYPSDIDPALVQLGDYSLLTKSTVNYTVLNQFIRGPTVRAADKFFSMINANLGNDARTFGGWAGELLFTSNDEATLSLIDSVEGLNTNTASRSYKWSQSDDGAISLKSPDSKDITIRFLKAVSGGYNVLYSYADGSYSRHDLIYDAAPVVDESTFAGRYRFISIPTLEVIEIFFHKDKTVTSIPNTVNGYWFQDTNGDIVSFECTTLARQDISNYAECYSAFEHLSDMAFVHIRRLGFLHKNGNQYQLRYSSSFYGDIFNTTSVSDDYLSLAWTYRWLRVSD